MFCDLPETSSNVTFSVFSALLPSTVTSTHKRLAQTINWDEETFNPRPHGSNPVWLETSKPHNKYPAGHNLLIALC